MPLWSQAFVDTTHDGEGWAFRTARKCGGAFPRWFPLLAMRENKCTSFITAFTSPVSQPASNHKQCRKKAFIFYVCLFSAGEKNWNDAELRLLAHATSNKHGWDLWLPYWLIASVWFRTLVHWYRILNSTIPAALGYPAYGKMHSNLEETQVHISPKQVPWDIPA